MPRLSKEQLLPQELELQALAFFERTLSELPDARRPQGKRYPLRTVIVIALMAMVCGADDAQAMQLWGESNAEWLAGGRTLALSWLAFHVVGRIQCRVVGGLPPDASWSTDAGCLPLGFWGAGPRSLQRGLPRLGESVALAPCARGQAHRHRRQDASSQVVATT
jgi:hypothetical protein